MTPLDGLPGRVREAVDGFIANKRANSAIMRGSSGTPLEIAGNRAWADRNDEQIASTESDLAAFAEQVQAWKREAELYRASQALPETWPLDPPILGTVPSEWSHNAAGFVALVQSQPTLWLMNSSLKYLNVHIDTRDGGFTLTDKNNEPASPDIVLKAIREARARFDHFTPTPEAERGA